MTERNIVGTEKVSASRPAAQAIVTKAARRAGSAAGMRRVPVSAEERERMIAMAAYYRAERRGFAPGHELEDWCEAEAEIERWLVRK